MFQNKDLQQEFFKSFSVGFVGHEDDGNAAFVLAGNRLFAGQSVESLTPQQAAAASLRNAKSYTQQALKSGALDDASIELIDQAEAIMKMVLDNLQKQAVPAEVSHRLANVVNELCACEKLCNGEIKTAVYDLSVATERLRDRIA